MNVQNSHATQVQQAPAPPPSSALGKVKDFFVSLGNGIARGAKAAFNTISNFFGSLGGNKALATRNAVQVDAPLTPRGESPVPEGKGATGLEYSSLRKASLEEIAQGHLDSQKTDKEQAGEIFTPPQQNDKEKFTKDYANAMTGTNAFKRMLAPENVASARQTTQALLETDLPPKIGEQGGAIMRGNTGVSAFMTGFYRAVGGEYSAQVLSETVNTVSKEGSLEVNPHNIEGDETTKAQTARDNTGKIVDIYNKLIDDLCASVDQVPLEICKSCKELNDRVLKIDGATKEHALDATGGALILRFLNPILFRPETHVEGHPLTDAPLGDGANRTCLLLSKLLQNQCNNTLAKEEFMAPLNDTVTANHDRFSAFLDAVIKRGEV